MSDMNREKEVNDSLISVNKKWFLFVYQCFGILNEVPICDCFYVNCFRFIQTNDEEQKLSQPLIVNGRYQSPWPTWRFPNLFSILRLLFTKDLTNLPRDRSVGYVCLICFIWNCSKHKRLFNFGRSLTRLCQCIK